MTTTITIVGLAHDFAAQKSYVNFVWAEDPTKRLGLEVPFGLPLDQLETAAREAVDALADELAACRIVKS